MSLHHAILGLLATTPMAHDDLLSSFERSAGQFWTAKSSEVQRTLGRLVQAELVRFDQEPVDGQPTEGTYHLTGLGRAVLDEWIPAEPEAYPRRSAFLMHLLFSADLDATGVEAMLTTRMDAVGARLARLRQLELGLGPADSSSKAWLEHTLGAAALHNSIAHAQAELDWARHWCGVLHERASAPTGQHAPPP